jgi:hypothetical protein
MNLSPLIEFCENNWKTAASLLLSFNSLFEVDSMQKSKDFSKG